MVDQEALKTFDELYYDTYYDVLKYVICNCSNIDDVNDIVQNIYLGLLKRLKKNKTLPISKQYIMGIAKNKVKDYYRFHYKNKIVSLFSSKDNTNLLDTIPSNENVQDYFIKEDNLKQVWEFLRKKKIIIFKIFYLHYYNNVNIKEIAKELNISESNVKNYLYRTLKELKILIVGGDNNE